MKIIRICQHTDHLEILQILQKNPNVEDLQVKVQIYRNSVKFTDVCAIYKKVKGYVAPMRISSYCHFNTDFMFIANLYKYQIFRKQYPPNIEN